MSSTEASAKRIIPVLAAIGFIAIAYLYAKPQLTMADLRSACDGGDREACKVLDQRRNFPIHRYTSPRL